MRRRPAPSVSPLSFAILFSTPAILTTDACSSESYRVPTVSKYLHVTVDGPASCALCAPPVCPLRFATYLKKRLRLPTVPVVPVVLSLACLPPALPLRSCHICLKFEITRSSPAASSSSAVNPGSSFPADRSSRQRGQREETWRSHGSMQSRWNWCRASQGRIRMSSPSSNSQTQIGQVVP